MRIEPPQQPVVILTRPQGRNEALAQSLIAHGIRCVVLPALELQVTPYSVPDPRGFDLILFVSSFAVQCYLYARQDMPWPVGVWAAGVGAGTRQAMGASGIIPDHRMLCPNVDSQQDSEALWQTLQAAQVHPQRVLIVRGNTGRNWLARQWCSAGVQVQELIAYHRHAAIWPQEAKAQLLDAARASAVLLASSVDSVHAIAQNLQRLNLSGLLGQYQVLAVHPRIAACVAQLQENAGVTPLYPVIVTKPDQAAMLQAILQLATQPA